MAAALDLAGAFGLQNVNLYKQLVPMITRIGLDIVLTFPLQSGAAAIPMTEPGAAAKVSITPTTDPASVIAKFEVKFDANGVPAILGITTSDLAALGLNVPFALSPATIQALQAGNIQNMEFRSKADGVFLYANGAPLPNVFWDSTLLTNVSDLYAQLNSTSPYLPLVKSIVPNLDKGDIDILFHFPLAQGAQPIPAQMHP